MPKAKPFPIGDEDEKTTTDDAHSQWEDEASTTVEQGDVAEKIRSLAADTPPRRTITNITNTGATGLDESTVDDQHADPMLAITPVPRDEVAQLVVTQGNDLGQLLSVQPGKTYTIGRAVDNDLVLTDIAVSRKHFELRHEDGAWVIADRGSGNGTVVNGNIEDNPFMLANGDLVEIGNTIFRFEQPNGVARRQPDFSVDVDDEEMSTVAGKAMHTDPVEAATPVEQPLRPLAPGPIGRARPKTLPPPTPLRPSPSAPPPMSYAPPQLPASTLPMQQMANRAPVLPPQSPTMLGADAMGRPLPGVMPTTIPGQGMQRGSQQRPQQYPVTSDIPPHSVHAQMLKIAANAGRTDPSTAHVSPTPYSAMGIPAAPMSSYSPPQLSKRTKYAIGAAGLSVLAAILTIAIVKSGSAKSAPTSAAAGGSATGSSTLKVEPIKSPVADETPKPEAPKPETPKPPDQKMTVDTPKPAPPPTAPPPPTPTPAPRQETAKAPEQKIEQRTKKQDPAPRRRDRTQTQQAQVAPAPPPPSPPAEARQPAPRRPATVDTTEARKASDTAYALKKFQEAANILYAAAKSSSDDEARVLRHRAENIDRFARLYSAGSAPAATQIEQFEKLRGAEPLDQFLGNVFNADIEAKLAQVSSKAALSYMGLHQYDNALKAVEKSESLGVSNGNTRIVRATLDSNAQSIYNEANKEADSNPSGAKDKLHKVLQFIDPKSPWYDKTNKLLKRLEK